MYGFRLSAACLAAACVVLGGMGIVLPAHLGGPGQARAAELPNTHVYPALERQAIAYMAGAPYRMPVSETSSNKSTVYVVAYRPGVHGTFLFRFDVRVQGRQAVLATPPTRLR